MLVVAAWSRVGGVVVVPGWAVLWWFQGGQNLAEDFDENSFLHVWLLSENAIFFGRKLWNAELSRMLFGEDLKA
jgi:hypothetical protein